MGETRISSFRRKPPAAEAGGGNEPQEETVRWGSISRLESPKNTRSHSMEYPTRGICVSLVPLETHYPRVIKSPEAQPKRPAQRHADQEIARPAAQQQYDPHRS